jgi:hypothetical protein
MVMAELLDQAGGTVDRNNAINPPRVSAIIARPPRPGKRPQLSFTDLDRRAGFRVARPAPPATMHVGGSAYARSKSTLVQGLTCQSRSPNPRLRDLR